VISGIPLVTGADLLAQYACMGLGFKLLVVCDDNTQDYPTKTDLGSRSHLLVSTE
ncbi:phage baseplate plug protein, partial [Escherichia coli]